MRNEKLGAVRNLQCDARTGTLIIMQIGQFASNSWLKVTVELLYLRALLQRILYWEKKLLTRKSIY
jgi:hypothetical protein